MTLLWKPWTEVVTLREELLSGKMALNDFAADLSQALTPNNESPEYEDPNEFFSRTFPTVSLRNLVKDVAHRLQGNSPKAVRQLHLTYGGGKTHTLVTLLHLFRDPNNLPSLPAVNEFKTAIGQNLPQARVAALCFDKIDSKTGLKVKAPSGESMLLLQPWSILAWQLAGPEGLELINPNSHSEERATPPAEPLLIELLRLPSREGLSTLILIDELLVFARIKVGEDPSWRGYLSGFFQYLTQAVAKSDRVCLVASLLASLPSMEDQLGQDLKNEFYNIFNRQREEIIEPVSKDEVVEILRRSFFTPDSILNLPNFRSHAQSAIQGFEALGVINESTLGQASLEELYYKSYPFHPELIDVFYSKWTQISGFQKTRGALRIFALALNDAFSWDKSPLISSSCFLAVPDEIALSRATGELVDRANNAEPHGSTSAWGGILQKELAIAKINQKDLLQFRELEQAVITIFLHSLPLGQSASTRDIKAQVALTRPDSIALEKALRSWSENSYWLDDQSISKSNAYEMPNIWRLGTKPNLTQMHAQACVEIDDNRVLNHLTSLLSSEKKLTNGFKDMEMVVHVATISPSDIEDNDKFHYVILGPNEASKPGDIAPLAKKILAETTPNHPRAFRNNIFLLTPSPDGLNNCVQKIRSYLAWNLILETQEKQLDETRKVTAKTNQKIAFEQAKDAILYAWRQVVTTNKDGSAFCFSLNLNENSHFRALFEDPNARLHDKPLNEESLLPGAPYEIWKEGDTAHRAQELYSSFAKYPELPRIPKRSNFYDTLSKGCQTGLMVLRLARPDQSIRTWWLTTPEPEVLKDKELELVLPKAAELTEINSDLLLKGKLQTLWPESSPYITVKDVINFFSGGKTVTLQQEHYSLDILVPKAEKSVALKAIQRNVESGAIWLTSSLSSYWAEPINENLDLLDEARLNSPPKSLTPLELLSGNISEAWEEKKASVKNIVKAINQKEGCQYPWKVFSEAIQKAISFSFVKIDQELPIIWSAIKQSEAENIVLKQISQDNISLTPQLTNFDEPLVADLDISELILIPDLVDKLLAWQGKFNIELRANLRFQVSDPAQLNSESRALLKQYLVEFCEKYGG
jgi:hypothetical protein